MTHAQKANNTIFEIFSFYLFFNLLDSHITISIRVDSDFGSLHLSLPFVFFLFFSVFHEEVWRSTLN